MNKRKADKLIRTLNSFRDKEHSSDNDIIYFDIPEGLKEKQVREFYEKYPYHKNPPTADLHERINQYRQDWSNWCIPISLEGKRTLDVGCGCGFNLAIHASLAAAALGMDVSLTELRRAYSYLKEQGVLEKIFLARSDICHLPLPDNSFDIITCIGVLHHIHHHSTALKKMSALLDKNGVLLLGLYHPGGRFLHRIKRKIIGICCGKNPESWVKRANRFFNIEKEAERYRIPADIYVLDSYAVPIEKAFSVKHLSTLLQQAGLKLLEIRPSPGLSFPPQIQKYAGGGKASDGQAVPLKHRLIDWWLTLTNRHHYWCLAIGYRHDMKTHSVYNQFD
jgi:ubiquinone/menaquinone biosynthesis C-methylase UbiE